VTGYFENGRFELAAGYASRSSWVNDAGSSKDREEGFSPDLGS